MATEELTQEDARRLASIARAKAERWGMIAEDLENTYHLRDPEPRERIRVPVDEIVLDDVRREIVEGGSAKRRNQLASTLGVSVEDLEAFLVPENGIKVDRFGWIKLVDNGLVGPAERQVSQ